MKIDLKDSHLRWSGRIHWGEGKKPLWIFPATSLCFRMRGSKAVLRVRNYNQYWENSLGVIVDGVQRKCVLKNEGVTEIVLFDEGQNHFATSQVITDQIVNQQPVVDKSKEGAIRLEDEKEVVPMEKVEQSIEQGIHEVLIFKRMDSCHLCEIESLELSEGSKLLSLPEVEDRRIEVYGDSVSAGEVSEAVEYTGKEDPEHNGEYSNSWYSYAWITARKLHAQIHDIAQGGIALLDNTGWFLEPEAVGMESAWDKIQYNPYYGKLIPWDFQEYRPDVVLVAIGQNDNHPEDYMKEDYQGEKAVYWREHYKQFLLHLREKYPEAHIICHTTLLCHDASWDNAIDEVVESLNDKKISHYLFKRNGCGTPGHLRIPEAEEMAGELSTYILKLTGWK